MRADNPTVTSLSDMARLDTMVTVVDCATVLDLFGSDADVEAPAGSTAELAADDERALVALLVDQIEFANVILLNKIDLVDAATVAKVADLCAKLNPGATVIQTDHSNVALDRILSTGAFSFEQATLAPGWLQSLREEHVPETIEYGISSFVYRRRRPFHVGRLHALLIGNSGGFLGADGGVLRSKGFCWLSVSDATMFEWSSAGPVGCMVPSGSLWFAAMDDEELADQPDGFADRAQADFADGEGLICVC